jgi:hypothetical protein
MLGHIAFVLKYVRERKPKASLARAQ